MSERENEVLEKVFKQGLIVAELARQWFEAGKKKNIKKIYVESRRFKTILETYREVTKS